MEHGNRKLKFEATIPNIITIIRLIAIVPLIILLSHWPKYRLSSFILFLAIWCTDMLDGFIARKYNQISDFGKLLDPVVDKIFQLSVAVTMTVIGRLPLWVPIFILCREAIMILGGYILLRNYDVVVYSDIFGKTATCLYVVAFSLLFFIPLEPTWVKHVIFIPPVVLSIVATANYARKNIHNIKFNDKNNK